MIRFRSKLKAPLILNGVITSLPRVPDVDVNTALATLEVPDLPVPPHGSSEGADYPRHWGDHPSFHCWRSGNGGLASSIDRVPFQRINAQFTLDNPTLKVTNPPRPTSVSQEAKSPGPLAIILFPGAELVADIDIIGVQGDAIAKLYDTSPGLTIWSYQRPNPSQGPTRRFAHPDCFSSSQSHLSHHRRTAVTQRHHLP